MISLKVRKAEIQHQLKKLHFKKAQLTSEDDKCQFAFKDDGTRENFNQSKPFEDEKNNETFKITSDLLDMVTFKEYKKVSS